MKLLSLKLCNFRQFYGKTPEIILASGERNTTVIHGNNGAGKTTLLNAFTWILYEQFTAAFASPQLLINKRAINEVDCGVSVECWGEIQFEHDNKRYQLKRKCYGYRDKEGKIEYSNCQFFMLVAGDDGRWYPPLEQPEDIINQILPESLHHYFFFDGEHIEHIFRRNEKNNIAEDTKELLGVKVLDRAVDHLKKVKKTLNEELKAMGNSEIKQLIQQQNRLEQEKESLENTQQNIVKRLSQQEQLKKQLSQQLLDLGGAQELKKLKEKLEFQEKTLRHSLIDCKQKIQELISSQGYTIFLPETIHKFEGFIEQLRQKGALPSGIKQQFIQQLLAEQKCICGTELHPENQAYQLVKNWLNRAGIAEIEEAAIRLESQGKELQKKPPSFWHEIDQYQAKINQFRLELAQTENELDKISQQFRHYPDADIQAIQKQVDTTEATLRELLLDQGANQQRIDVINKKIEDLSKQITKQKLKEEKQILAQRRIKATQEAIDRILDVKNRLEKQFRLSLEQRVQDIFSTISFTPYLPRINQNYEVSLVENTSGIAIPVAASTGENQILSLSFIGGIMDSVRRWSQKNTLMGIDSSTFPIVMDSPFGSLDEIYRRQVAKAIPQLANQLVILVTKTQWRGEVATETYPYIGKQYVLLYHSPKPDAEEDSLTVNGISYPLVKRSLTPYEYTEITEIEPEF